MEASKLAQELKEEAPVKQELLETWAVCGVGLGADLAATERHEGEAGTAQQAAEAAEEPRK